MKKRISWLLIAVLTTILAFSMKAGEDVSGIATPRAAPGGSQIETQLRINVKEGTKNVHLVSATNNPNIITKCYVLQHADPYELRPYFREAVRSESVSGDRTKTECIKFNDGSGVLIISAEDYRFGKQDHGMGFDEMVEILDKPKITSSSGTIAYSYFPKYVSAAWLYAKLKDVGMNVCHDEKEMEGGKDKIGVDNSLNALLIYIPLYQVKTINEMIKTYDTPVPEVKVKYSVYELDNELDDSLGVDFQAWKNGTGSDLFTAASRFGNQWDFAGNAVGYPWTGGGSHAQFIKFSPKWNTKYFDFLASKGKANIITAGELSLMNNQEGKIETTTKLPGFKDGTKISDINVVSYISLTDKRIYESQQSSEVPPDSNGVLAGRYRFSATDENGNTISLTQQNGAINANIAAAGNGTNGGQNPYRGDFMLVKIYDGTRYYYIAEINENEAAVQGVSFVRFPFDRDAAGALPFGEMVGPYKVTCYNAKLEVLTATYAGTPTAVAATWVNAGTYTYKWETVTSWSTDQNFTISRDYTRDTSINSYGFSMTLTPVICEKSSLLNVNLVNTNLIGFLDNGTPRTSRSEVNTQVMVNNTGSKIVIGGVEKKQVVRSVNKIPWLGDLPIIGWACSSESEVSKSSQLVTVLECVSVMPDTKVPDKIKKEIEEMTAKVADAGEKISVGFDQFLLDEEKKESDPLP